jgi:urease accessory protein
MPLLDDSLFALLQFSDSLFPAGGYAHSFGLEFYVQSGRVRDSAGVEAFLRAYLEGVAGPSDAVAVAATMDPERSLDLQLLCRIDETLDAMRPVREFRQASRQMGHQTLRVAAELAGLPLLHGLLDAVESGKTSGHHSMVFGLIARLHCWPMEPSLLAYLYSNSSLIVGAALRAIPLGQLEGQRILWAVRPLCQELARDAFGKGLADLWSFAPGIEIAGLRHARLEARLFRS